MSKRKTIFKTISVILSLLIMLAVTPLGVSATVTTQMTPDVVTADVVVGNGVAGATSLEDLPYENEPVKVLNGTSWVNVTPSDDGAVQSQTDYSLNTIITDNGDGTCTMELYDYPVKFINEVGEVQDISLEIASASNGSYKTKANDIQTVFPKKISDGISLSGKGVSVKLKPFVSTGLSSNVSSTINTTHMTVDTTVTKLDNETVSYYYDNKTTLEYSLTYTGFKEDIVVSEYTGQTEYTFLLETGGLALTKIDESYYLTDENGEIKATLGDIIIFTADERNNALGSMSHITVRENQQYLITIHIDAEYLRDEKTVYPIRIDPTIEITYDNNGAGAIQDVTVNSTAGSSGSSGSIYVGKRNTYGISRTLMKFPGLNLSAIPSNCTIDSAYIEIRDLLCQTTSMTVNASMFVGYEWNESTANWDNTQPHIYTPIKSGSINVSYSNGASLSQKHRYSINITQAIRLWKSGLVQQARGIILKADDSVENGSSELYKTFASYNRASNKPSLKINYTSNVTHTAYGWLGFVNSAVVNGWVWCSDHPNESLDVVLTPTNTATNQSWFSVGPANIYRSDVQDAGFGTGNYGFSCAMNDWTAFPPGTYSVSAVAILPSGQTYTLHASPKTYTHSLIRLNKAELSLYAGSTETLVASAVSDSVSLDNLVWSSSDTNVVTVDSSGKVTAVSIGSATITVQCDSFNRAFCQIYVTNYRFGLTVQNAYPYVCEMGDKNYASFGVYADNLVEKLRQKMSLRFDYRGTDSCPSDLKNKNYFSSASSRFNIDDVDLMIFTGHGYAKNRCQTEGLFEYNSLHFGNFDNGSPHIMGNGTDSRANFTTQDALHFGQNTSTKWLVAYTCNFLNVRQGDPNVMHLLDNGGRLIMGLSTKSYVVAKEGADFGKLLLDGETFRDAFFQAADENQEIMSNSKKIYSMLYYGPDEEGTLNDTITQPLENIERTETKIIHHYVNMSSTHGFEEY